MALSVFFGRVLEDEDVCKQEVRVMREIGRRREPGSLASGFHFKTEGKTVNQNVFLEIYILV